MKTLERAAGCECGCRNLMFSSFTTAYSCVILAADGWLPSDEPMRLMWLHSLLGRFLGYLILSLAAKASCTSEKAQAPAELMVSILMNDILKADDVERAGNTRVHALFEAGKDDNRKVVDSGVELKEEEKQKAGQPKYPGMECRPVNWPPGHGLTPGFGPQCLPLLVVAASRRRRLFFLKLLPAAPACRTFLQSHRPPASPVYPASSQVPRPSRVYKFP
ncbi:hypothetical protein B0H65DRAFT_340460 [Neurospora tetraspora]|uniref:Uncharacterized protein n=1 Tax=Neurospora tetraspora TaxID=94610 RepID=A0AAE0MJR9_9PEZI|nr:hypothetical protein B0H65DRAFT_340460 [Neurospora tetraspora]